jgi:hypothetical protein
MRGGNNGVLMVVDKMLGPPQGGGDAPVPVHVAKLPCDKSLMERILLVR